MLTFRFVGTDLTVSFIRGAVEVNIDGGGWFRLSPRACRGRSPIISGLAMGEHRCEIRRISPC